MHTCLFAEAILKSTQHTVTKESGNHLSLLGQLPQAYTCLKCKDLSFSTLYYIINIHMVMLDLMITWHASTQPLSPAQIMSAVT